MFGLGAAFGPWLVGRIKDETGQYDGGLLGVVIMIVISIIGFMVIVLSNHQKEKYKR